MHLHVGLDRAAQGRDGRAPQRRQLLRRHGRAPRPRGSPGVWLAVTSISFDISVLELFWTLARGFKVVLAPTTTRARAAPAPARSARTDAHRLQPVLLRERRGRRRSGQVPPAARGREVRRPARLRRGVDARAPLPRVRRALPEPGGDRRARSPRSPSASRSAPAAWCCRCTTRSASPRSGRVVDNLSQRPRRHLVRVRLARRTTSCSRPRTSPDAEQVDARRHRDRAAAVARRVASPCPAATGQPVERRASCPRPVQPELPIWITAAGNPRDVRAGRRASAPTCSRTCSARSSRSSATKIAVYRAAWQRRPPRRRARHADAAHVRRRRRRRRCARWCASR